MKLYRILGRRGRITIPHEICTRVGYAYNDVLSITEAEDGRSIIIKRELLCDDCKGTRNQKNTEAKENEKDGITLLEFLNGLTEAEQHAALVHLSVKLAEKQGGVIGDRA
ncbi:MAG: hypothetical protein IKC03_08210 [Oscillospiraceae bacterium]|nr:hypothetical protein [Oscillospiraceae bacterium]